MTKNDKTNEMTPEMRKLMISAILNAVQAMDDQTLKIVYMAIIHIQ